MDFQLEQSTRPPLHVHGGSCTGQLGSEREHAMSKNSTIWGAKANNTLVKSHLHSGTRPLLPHSMGHSSHKGTRFDVVENILHFVMKRVSGSTAAGLVGWEMLLQLSLGDMSSAIVGMQ